MELYCESLLPIKTLAVKNTRIFVVPRDTRTTRTHYFGKGNRYERCENGAL